MILNSNLEERKVHEKGNGLHFLLAPDLYQQEKDTTRRTLFLDTS